MKIVAFIAHLFRLYSQHINPQQETLAQCVVQLLLTCPGEFAAARKDLLLGIRHVLMTGLNKSLLRKAERLLEEKTMIGEGKLVFDTLRPLAYATMADVVHHVKAELTLVQLSRVVYIFSRNLHDASLPLSVQSAAVRLLLNLVDHIHRTSEAGDGRQSGRPLLVRILYTLTAKFESLQHLIPKVFAQLNANSALIARKMEENTDAASGVTFPTLVSLSSPAPVLGGSRVDDDAEDAVKEIKLMLSTMVMGLKTVVWCCRDIKVLNPSTGKKYAPLMDEDDIATVGRLLDSGLRCFRIYSLPIPPHVSTTPLPHGHDEKDVIEQFATIFTQMEQRAFREVFTQRMESLFLQIVESPRSPLIYLPQHFLGANLPPNNNSGAAGHQAAIGRTFADILLTFLVKRLRDMTVPFSESTSSGTYVHLFRHVFASVEVNDVVLRPYIAPIVTTILRIVTEVRNPINYFAILRALFRSIGGGKFELLYKEFLPCLTGDHAVLTRSGWRSITRIAVGEEVASFNRVTSRHGVEAGDAHSALQGRARWPAPALPHAGQGHGRRRHGGA